MGQTLGNSTVRILNYDVPRIFIVTLLFITDEVVVDPVLKMIFVSDTNGVKRTLWESSPYNHPGKFSLHIDIWLTKIN